MQSTKRNPVNCQDEQAHDSGPLMSSRQAQRLLCDLQRKCVVPSCRIDSWTRKQPWLSPLAETRRVKSAQEEATCPGCCVEQHHYNQISSINSQHKDDAKPKALESEGVGCTRPLVYLSMVFFSRINVILARLLLQACSILAYMLWCSMSANIVQISTCLRVYLTDMNEANATDLNGNACVMLCCHSGHATRKGLCWRKYVSLYYNQRIFHIY